MILSEVHVDNYRKFINTSFSMEDDITLLAGANNSGKTSLVELLGSLLSNSKSFFSANDIPVTIAKEWSDAAFSTFVDNFAKNIEKEQTIKNIIDVLFSIEDPKKSILMSPTTIKFQIDYDKANDDIRNFAEYIMDLDPNKYSFFFQYTFQPTPSSLRQSLDKNYEKLKSRFDRLNDNPARIEYKRDILKEKIIDLYASSIIEKCSYTDSGYTNSKDMDLADFKNLFNYRHINAGRSLDDQISDKTHRLSKNMVDLASQDDDWKTLLSKLPDKILQPIEEADINGVVRKASIDTLSETIQSIAKTNGGQTGEMIIEMDVSEDAIGTLLKQITSAKYLLEGHYLNESSQGLGYSNMIYIHLQLEVYKKTVNLNLVNIFIIEEPESHMHPQMQNAFVKYLRQYYQNKKIQGLVTTHSSEMVRVTPMKKLRVARPVGCFDSKIFDFSSFAQIISGDEILVNFYDWFYEIGFSDVVFADRVVLYEGDTERMLIRKLLTFSQFQSLNQQYIAFVQVGGAYAHNYSNLIKFLKIKTLILTDLDYAKDASDEQTIHASTTTNATINGMYKEATTKDNPTVADLYQWRKDNGNILYDDCAYLNYQCLDDGFARTLEEAMLSKFYSIKVYESKDRDDWMNLRKGDKLKYTIPQKPGKYDLRDIVAHTSNGKTDFMYSVILNDKTLSMLPNYVEEGLKWLMK